MKGSPSIRRFGAALLLTVFLLNTVVGFACAIWPDMGANSTHHHHEHNEGKAGNAKGTAHHGNVDHHHHHHRKEKDNCCNDNVMKFVQTDKSLSPLVDFSSHPACVTLSVPSFCNIDLLATSRAKVNSRYFARSYHPPIPDIRIAIQSFQI